MRISLAKKIILLSFLLCVLPLSALGQAPLKIGLIAPFSGHFASYGKEMEAGMRAYLELHGDKVAGRKLEIITRDTTGPAPDVSKRLALELITREKVDFLVGFGLTPNAMAVAPVITQGKKPTIIFNAATSIITERSPFFLRSSFTLPQTTKPLAEWIAKQGVNKVFTLVADYAPGLDAEKTFHETFTKAGGTIVGSLRPPIDNQEFAPYLQRVKDAKPDALYVFLPPPSIALMKSFRERGLGTAGIKLIASGVIVDDPELLALGDSADGLITAFHYSEHHKSKENEAFLKAFRKVSGKSARPGFMAVQAFDGTGAIYDAVTRLKGDTSNPKRIMDALKHFKTMSPRGPIEIDPETRDIVQSIYIRKTEKIGDKYYNVEFDSVPKVKDPVKEK